MQLTHARTKRGLSLTPLIDAVFILLLFFMVATSFQELRGVDLNLLASEDANTANVDTTPSATITVHVRGSGEILVNEQAVEDGDILRALQTAAADQPALRIVIEADPDAMGETLIQTLVLVRKSDLGPVTMKR